MPTIVSNNPGFTAVEQVPREPKKKGAQPTPSERLVRFQDNFPTYNLEEQSKIDEGFTNEFAPYMLSRLSQEQLTKIMDVCRERLQQNASQPMPLPPAIVVPPAFKSTDFFAIPLFEVDFINHKSNIGIAPKKTEDQNPVYVGGSGLAKEVFDYKILWVTSTQNAGSNANIVNTDLATSVIVGKGGTAIEGYRKLFNDALIIAKKIAEGMQVIDIQIGKVEEFAKNGNKAISEAKEELVRTSKTMAVEQNNLTVELGNPGAYTNKGFRGYVGDFPVIEPKSTKVPASEPVTSADFTKQLLSVNELLNHKHQFQLTSVIAQIGRATGLRHFLSTNPQYAQDVKFLADIQECMNRFKEVHGKQSELYGKLGGAEVLVTQASVQLQSELVQLRTNYETLLKEAEKAFNVYRRQIVELATNMKSKEEIRELHVDAKPYEIK
jgi:hypothetical protein